jgi:predicted GNAT family acetyltransferase
VGSRWQANKHGDAARARGEHVAHRAGLHAPTQRGHGYGSAVTAAAADLARRTGTPDVVLFADLANPVSNAIYQRIGFEPVLDSVRIDFVTLG